LGGHQQGDRDFAYREKGRRNFRLIVIGTPHDTLPLDVLKTVGISAASGVPASPL
jgi:hypothetical protein